MQDDGKTFDYERGKRTKTVFASALSTTGLTFAIKESNRLFVPKRFLPRFHLDRAPLDTKGWDAGTRVLTIPADEAGKKDHAVAIRLTTKKLPARPAPLLVADKAVVGAATTGANTPHFFPGPVLPSVVKAIDYDYGGEGVAYHRAVSAPASTYRADSAGIAGEGLAGLAKGDWARYSVDAANGGYYDLFVRAKGGGGLRLLSADRVVTTVALKGEATIPSVYL